MEKKITKQNIIIANFMGCRYDENRNSHEDSEYYYEDCELEYHHNWNWLMEVVERINLIDDYRFTVYIASMDTRIEDSVTGNIVIDINCKHAVDELIKSVYEAVVEFIKWYNSAKENTTD